MASLNGFNANNVEPKKDFEPIPAGDYIAVITESEEKRNSAGTGSYVALTFEIIEGPHKGRRLWVNLNLNHPNADTVRIAKSELSSICRAVKILEPGDSAALHNIPMVIKVVLEKRKDNGQDTNRIKMYKLKDGSASAPVSAASGDKSSKPWERKA